MAIKMKINERVRAAILRALATVGSSAGASVIQSYLQAEGVQLQDRTIRLYLLRLDQEGMTRLVSRRAGRVITERGREELARDKVIEKVGFTASHLDAQAYRTSFDLKTQKGMLAVLSVRVPKASLLRAIEEMKYVFARRLGAGSNVVVAKEAERLTGPVAVPGLIEVATISSVSLTSVLVTGGIPVVPRFGGLLEIHEGRPLRFVELIDYRGSTIDPVELFVRAGIRSCWGGFYGDSLCGFTCGTKYMLFGGIGWPWSATGVWVAGAGILRDPCSRKPGRPGGVVGR